MLSQRYLLLCTFSVKSCEFTLIAQLTVTLDITLNAQMSVASHPSLYKIVVSSVWFSKTQSYKSGDHKFVQLVMNECQGLMNVCCQKTMIVCVPACVQL